MKSPDQFQPQSESNPQNPKEIAISHYVEKIISASSEESADEARIGRRFAKLSPREKADMLFSRLLTSYKDQNTVTEARTKSKGLRSPKTALKDSIALKIKALWSDAEARKIFLEKYSEMRLDQKKIASSDLGITMRELRQSEAAKAGESALLERELFRMKNDSSALESDKDDARDDLSIINDELRLVQEELNKNENLVALPKTEQNTDALAIDAYERIAKYHQEMENGGFVWLPHFQDLLKKISNAIENTKKFPLLIGEPGSGKTNMAEAAARLFTDNEAIKVLCGPSTNERDLEAETKITATGTHEVYKGIARALTGYKSETEQECSNGRAVFIEEILKANLEKIFSIIKNAASKKAGENYSSEIAKPILPGAAIIAATNPPGERHGLPEIPPALEREFTPINVDYPPADQLYEFMLASLMDKNGHIAAAREELGPKYREIELTEDEQKNIPEIDGQRAIKKQELIKDNTSPEHGYLYRLSFAIKALQDAYVLGNEDEKEKDNALRIKNNKIANGTDGDILRLSKSIITLKDVKGFMQSYLERHTKKEAEFQTESLAEFIKIKLNKFLAECNDDDREKCAAIFDYFHLQDAQTERLQNAKPITPKEIGYLMTKTPRPLIWEEIQPEVDSDHNEDADEEKEKPLPEIKKYENIEITLENGESVRIKTEAEGNQPFHSFDKAGELIDIEEGLEFVVKNEQFIVVGVVDETDNYNKDEYKNKIACQVGKLHRLFSVDEIEKMGERFDGWKGKMVKFEREDLLQYFGKPIDVPKLPTEITKAKMEFWTKNQLAVHYSPGIEIKQEDDFPGQKKKLDSDVYRWIKEGKISPETIKLPKGWVLVDARPKPNYNDGDQMYENDILAPVLEQLRKDGHIENFKNKGSRFNISNDELRKREVMTALAEVLKVKAEQVSLPKTALFNYLGNAFYPEWGETNTYEWFEEEFQGGRRLGGGGSVHGGLSGVVFPSSGLRYDSLGFRPLVVFS